MNSALAQCSLQVSTTLPLVCICSLFSFLCGVGIGANDLSANFAMVVGSGSLDMKKAIIYCTVFELLGAACMGGHVSNTIRNGIVEPVLFRVNRDVVVIGMTAACFAAALWLYLSTVFGLPVSITHTVVGSLLGYAVFSTFSFANVKARGLVVIVVSWVAAPVAACAVTAVIFYYLRRDVFKVKGRSFELALRVLPGCLLASLLVDFAFVMIEKPPIMTQTFARFVPLPAQLALLLLCILSACYAAQRWYFPQVAEEAWAASSFVWESRSLRTEVVEPAPERAGEAAERLDNRLSFFAPPQSSSSTSSATTSERESEAAESEEEEEQGTAAPHAREAPHATPKMKTTGSGSNTSGETAPLLPSASASGERVGGPPASAVALASIDPSDRRLVLRGNVRLAPTGRRSPLPSVSGRNTPGGGSSVTGTTSSAAFRPAASVLEAASGADVRSSSRGVMYSRGGYGTAEEASVRMVPSSPTSVHSDDEFGEEDWAMDHPMEPIRFGGLKLKPLNPRAEYLFTSLQVVAGSMSSFVHGAVAGANATATFVVLYEAFTNHELGEADLGSSWSVLPAMLGIAIGMFALGASLMKTVGMELVTVTPVRGWSIQVGGTAVTMVLTGLGIPVSLSQSQVGAAVGCGVLDARMAGVSWPLVAKIVGGWVVTLVISATTTGVAMWFLYWILC